MEANDEWLEDKFAVRKGNKMYSFLILYNCGVALIGPIVYIRQPVGQLQNAVRILHGLKLMRKLMCTHVKVNWIELKLKLEWR